MSAKDLKLSALSSEDRAEFDRLGEVIYETPIQAFAAQVKRLSILAGIDFPECADQDAEDAS